MRRARPWNHEDDIKLIVLKARDLTTSRIACLLDQGSPTSIRDRRQRLSEKLRNEQTWPKLRSSPLRSGMSIDHSIQNCRMQLGQELSFFFNATG